ncbi:MAG: hypothetical protein K2W95_16595 [Candidatus Obscuribacterales bacterium]|nr:hypothetical protein [Candidatus Obscuribacterales bacterium]
MSECRETFESYWCDLVGAICASSKPFAPMLTFLEQQYSAPGRYYHTLEHICKMLQWLHEFESAPPAALQFAAFFHDAVYDTASKLNEELSAELAVEMLAKESDNVQMIDEVRRLILCTKKHLPDETNAARSGLFLDCDLMILAASPEEYKLYTEQIRQEYSQFSDAEYRVGRTHVLKSFISRDRIFFTDQIRREYEDTARANITREIEQLR